MAFWYAVDTIRVQGPAGGSDLQLPYRRTLPMLMVDTVEQWTVTHLQSGQSRTITVAEMRQAWPGGYAVAYETDTGNKEMSLVRTEEEIPQDVIDACNAIGPGGQFVVHLTTAQQRNTLYAAYPSLRDRWPDQP